LDRYKLILRLFRDGAVPVDQDRAGLSAGNQCNALGA